MARLQLGQVLLEMGALNRSELADALQRLRSLPGRRLGEYLVSEGIITETQVAKALGTQFSLPFGAADELTVDRAVAKMVSKDYVLRQKVLPLHEDRGTLMVAVVDPLEVYALDDLGFVSGTPVQAIIVTQDTFQALVERAFSEPKGSGPGTFKTPALGPGQSWMPPTTPAPPRESEPARPSAPVLEAGTTRDVAAAPRTVPEEATTVALTDEIMLGAIEYGASDIHLEPMLDCLRVRYRIDGVLREVRRHDKGQHAGIISRIKVMSGADISERRVPQDARIQLELAERTVDVRVSTMPTVHGEKAVLRILDRSGGIPSLSSLGMDASTLKRFHSLLSRSYGMILACGPTGSGKTTTIVSALQELNRPDVNVITIEDPVEYELDGVNHVPINPKAGLTFASGLRAMLRQDPDIILLGEIRDTETAEIATRAALTGHLLLSTMHTNDAASAISRLADMKVEPFLIASAVAGVVAQRLVRRLCVRCRQLFPLPPNDPLRYALRLPQDTIQAYRANGCQECQRTGYRGRLGLFEVLVINESMRQLIASGASTEEIRQEARKNGMDALVADGVAKALQGQTSLEEVLRVTVAD